MLILKQRRKVVQFTSSVKLSSQQYSEQKRSSETLRIWNRKKQTRIKAVSESTISKLWIRRDRSLLGNQAQERLRGIEDFKFKANPKSIRVRQ